MDANGTGCSEPITRKTTSRRTLMHEAFHNNEDVDHKNFHQRRRLTIIYNEQVDAGEWQQTTEEGEGGGGAAGSTKGGGGGGLRGPRPPGGGGVTRAIRFKTPLHVRGMPL